MIKLQSVSKRFGSFQALKEISFELEAGCIAGFLGPNGAGKTTSMRLMTCYSKPNSGQITIAGLNTAGHANQIKRKLGYLPENSPLYKDMTVCEFLSMAASLRGISGQEQTRVIRRTMGDCGLGQHADKIILTLSKGYQQRVGLAQAMVHDPEILILDEPTTGLDPAQINEIHQLIKSFAQRKTVLLSTHILAHIGGLCDRALVLSQGRLVFDGTPQTMLQHDPAPGTTMLDTDASPEKVAELLNAVSGLERVEHLGTCNDKCYQRYRIHGTLGSDAPGSLLSLLVNRGVRVSQWHREPRSAERAFLSLTGH